MQGILTNMKLIMIIVHAMHVHQQLYCYNYCCYCSIVFCYTPPFPRVAIVNDQLSIRTASPQAVKVSSPIIQ